MLNRRKIKFRTQGRLLVLLKKHCKSVEDRPLGQFQNITGCVDRRFLVAREDTDTDTFDAAVVRYPWAFLITVLTSVALEGATSGQHCRGRAGEDDGLECWTRYPLARWSTSKIIAGNE
jgi:hypothetical protein